MFTANRRVPSGDRRTGLVCAPSKFANSTDCPRPWSTGKRSDATARATAATVSTPRMPVTNRCFHCPIPSIRIVFHPFVALVMCTCPLGFQHTGPGAPGQGAPESLRASVSG